MAIKPALCCAEQSSSFGHLRPPPQTSVTTTRNCPLLHILHHARAVYNSTLQESCQEYGVRPTESSPLQHCTWGHSKALDKALDTWYNIGVGVK